MRNLHYYPVALYDIRWQHRVRERLLSCPVPVDLVIPMESVDDRQTPILFNYAFIATSSNGSTTRECFAFLQEYLSDLLYRVGNRELTSVEVEWLGNLVAYGEEGADTQKPKIVVDDLVKVTRGPFLGFTGAVIGVQGVRCTLRLGALDLSVPMDALEPLQ